MKRKYFAMAGSALLLATGLAAMSTPSWAASLDASPKSDHSIKVCATAARGQAACTARQAADRNGHPVSNAVSPPSSALTPTQLRQAYNLTGTSSGGRTVAIVDAYGYPNLARDLNTYRQQFGLPQCLTSTGCLRILNENGGTKLPRFNLGWAQEQALDVDAVSAACPDCKIVVIEANTASFTDLGTAVQTAAKQGVAAISNSYGGSDASDATYGKYYNFPGIAVTASAGDSGYQGGSYPADSSYVTAVGGTSLFSAPGTPRGWSESVWSGTGSGCSAYNAALLAAAAYNTGCPKRAMNDVAAAADPNNGGLAVYYPTSSSTSTWGQFGGTSEASPIIASVYALSGNTGSNGLNGSGVVYANSLPYLLPAGLNDVTSGSNGSCPTTQWCNAELGWDGPTGLGTPNGTTSF